MVPPTGQAGDTSEWEGVTNELITSEVYLAKGNAKWRRDQPSSPLHYFRITGYIKIITFKPKGWAVG